MQVPWRNQSVARQQFDLWSQVTTQWPAHTQPSYLRGLVVVVENTKTSRSDLTLMTWTMKYSLFNVWILFHGLLKLSQYKWVVFIVPYIYPKSTMGPFFSLLNIRKLPSDSLCGWMGEVAAAIYAVTVTKRRRFLDEESYDSPRGFASGTWRGCEVVSHINVTKTSKSSFVSSFQNPKAGVHG